MTAAQIQPPNTQSDLLHKWKELEGWSPLDPLQKAADTKWLIDGVIPAGSINWMVASPESFKTFIALDMATCVASGRPWHGRTTDDAVVLYLAGEGGNDIHVRRAAADFAAGDTGPVCIVQLRPRLDEPTGLASLLALVSCAIGEEFCFPVVEKSLLDQKTKYLTPEEMVKYKALASGDRDYIGRAFGIHRSDFPKDFRSADDFALEISRPRYDAWDEAIAKVYQDDELNYVSDAPFHCKTNLLLIVDTYSQTSSDDAKPTVSRYIKTLRDLQDIATASGFTITVLVIDHMTKGGDTYMGSLAKEGDSDTMIEVTRHGNGHSVTLKSAKMKMSVPFLPIHLELKPIELEGFNDALGHPLTSLYVSDGEQAHKIDKVSGTKGDTTAAMILTLLSESGLCSLDDLRQRFIAHEKYSKTKPETVSRNFLRAVEN